MFVFLPHKNIFHTYIVQSAVEIFKDQTIAQKSVTATVLVVSDNWHTSVLQILDSVNKVGLCDEESGMSPLVYIRQSDIYIHTWTTETVAHGKRPPSLSLSLPVYLSLMNALSLSLMHQG